MKVNVSGSFALVLLALGLAAGSASTPHWAIDTQGAQTIVPGQTIKMYLVDYYTGQSNASWSVTGQGATITSTGMVTLAAGTYVTNQPLVVTATSGTYAARAILTIRSGPAILK